MVFFPNTSEEYNDYCGHPDQDHSAGCASGSVKLKSFSIVLRKELNYQNNELLNVVAHEIGHVVGLNHASRGSSLMYSSGGSLAPSPLSEDERRGICYLFPGQKHLVQCVNDAECPLTIRGPTACVDNQCVSGPAGFGGECESHSDCASGRCLRLVGSIIVGGADFRSIDGVCSLHCASRRDCPNNAMCREASCVPEHECFGDADCGQMEQRCISGSERQEMHTCSRVCRDQNDCDGNEECALDKQTKSSVCLPSKMMGSLGGCHIGGSNGDATIIVLILIGVRRLRRQVRAG